jgi:myo-inositol-1(or 4)-monophosphatase
MKPDVNFLETLARQAGEILRAGLGQQMRIDHKGVIDLVTEMDHRSEAFLLGEVRRQFPDHHIFSEEIGEVQGDQCCIWYVDPLDGTVNYAHGVPFFCVSIAYCEAGEVLLGVVYHPMQEECYSAEKGKGAWLNGQPIRVSTEQSLDGSLLVTGFPYDIRVNPQNNLDHYNRFSLCSQAVRRFGSAALDLCYVAAGRCEGYWEIRLKPWDIAAGGLIAAEAGAIVTNIHGGSDYLSYPQSILAAAPAIHPQMLAILNEKRAA